MRSLMLAPFSASEPTLTWYVNIWIYGMGWYTPESSGVIVIQKQNSSHFRQEVVLARVRHGLTLLQCSCCAVRK